MRTITLEEHFATPAFMQGPGRGLGDAAGRGQMLSGMPDGFARLGERLLDLGDGRIAEMDAAGIDVQVLSLNSPGVQQLGETEAIDLARETNDHLAAAVARYPGRLEGLATLPTGTPELAADELERLVTQQGFKGAVINGHNRGRYLDDQFYWPILERAESLQVPIYLHPTPPPQAVIDASYSGNFAPGVATQLASNAWGWHIETAIHVLRIILGGAFDRYPNLQLVIGHLGEALPFMLPRVDRNLSPQMTKLDRSVGAYLRENVHYTFSGFNFTPTFLDLFLQVGVGRIMFSADYPYGSMPAAKAFLDGLPISPADKEQIAHGNAERLLRL
ncbi:MAG: amidohydrolase family protein [Coriobacteriia bacterium]|nr:amidohydrolase family protein [Coriobacteriia bacterium]